MESKNIFGASDTTKAHIGADTDESFDSLHHTVGKGSTQAAAGNHKHPEYILTGSLPGAITDHGALTGLGDDDHPQYVHSGPAGDSMEGKLTINTAKGITLHNPTDSVVSLGAQNYGGYSLEVHADWDAETGALAPVRAGYPTAGEHLARVDWVGANYQPAGSYAGSGHGHNYVHGSLHGPTTVPANSTGTSYTVPHGLGAQPTACTVQALDDTGLQSIICSITTWDATNLIFLARNMGGAETVRFAVIAVAV